MHRFIKNIFQFSVLFFIGLTTLHAADYAVTPPYFDDIGTILSTLGLPADQIAEETLADYDAIKNYHAIFINCSGTIEDNMTAGAVAALQQYVSNGGVIYASDWAFVVLTSAFPGYVEYYSPSRIAPSETVNANINNQGMRDYLGVSSVQVDFNLGGWVPIKSVEASTVDVYVTGSDGDQYTNGRPILVKFDYGLGSVIYTSFHNEAGLSGATYQAVEYMVLLSVLSGTANNLARYFRDRGYIVVKENLSILSQGQSQSLSYDLSTSQDVDMAFGAAWKNSATFQINATPPSPAMPQSGSSASSPFYVEISSATNGTYSYTISPTAATGNQPFVVMAARRVAASDSVNSVKAYPNPFRSTEHSVVVFEGLTQQATLKIYTMSGELIKTIHKDDSSGTAFWELDNDEGGLVASGLYIYTAEGTSGSMKRGKLAIIR